MTLFKGSALFLICLAVVLGLSGCAGHSPNPQFYMLPADHSQDMPSGTTEISNASTSLGLVLERFPDYLDRPQIVTRIGDHQLQFSEFHRWSQPLKSSFITGLTERLRTRLETGSVWSAPFPLYAHPEMKVMLELYRLDGSLGEEAVLEAHWVVLDDSGNKVLTQKRTVLQEQVAGSGYEELLAAEGQLVSRLADEIAAAVEPVR